MEPVKRTEAPGYYEVIRFPMGNAISILKRPLQKVKIKFKIWNCKSVLVPSILHNHQKLFFQCNVSSVILALEKADM